MTPLKQKAVKVMDQMKFPRNSQLQKAIEQALIEARNEALEMSASIAEDHECNGNGCQDIPNEIRRLKENPTK